MTEGAYDARWADWHSHQVEPVQLSRGSQSKAGWLSLKTATAVNFGCADGGGWLPAGLTAALTGGLNQQIEHHLFPTVNHCHLPALRPLVAAAAARHGVPYREVGWREPVQP